MQSRTLLFFWWLILNITSVYCSRCNSKTTTPKRPHIVLILSDDQGWNDIGYNNPEVLTPRMDYLARNGVVLEKSYMQPVCSPSRGALLSGVYPFHSGLQWFVILPGNTKALPLDFKIIPQYLKDLGYSTHMAGKWHIGICKKELLPTSRGFDTFFGLLGGAVDYFTRSFAGFYDFWKDTESFNSPSLNGTYVTDLLTDQAVNIIEKNDPEDPLFMFLSFTSPHFPLQVPPKFLDKFSHITDESRRTYLAMVNSLDEAVGKVVDTLRYTGHMDNTVLIFLSDNGGASNFGGSNIPLRGDKSSLWEGGTRTPGFVYSPRYIPQTGYFSRRGCTFKGLIHAVDWLPTILDIAGLSHSKQKQLLNTIDGVSQWRQIRQCRGSARNEFIYNIDDDIGNSAAIRYGAYKLIVGEPVLFPSPIPGQPLPTVVLPINPDSKDIRLFNLEDDPYETDNIADRRPDIVAKLLERLDFYRKTGVPAQNPPTLPRNLWIVNGTLSTNYC